VAAPHLRDQQGNHARKIIPPDGSDAKDFTDHLHHSDSTQVLRSLDLAHPFAIL